LRGLFGNGCWSSNINLPKSTQQKKEVPVRWMSQRLRTAQITRKTGKQSGGRLRRRDSNACLTTCEKGRMLSFPELSRNMRKRLQLTAQRQKQAPIQWIRIREPWLNVWSANL